MTRLKARLHGAAKVVSGRAAGVARRHNWLDEEPTDTAGCSDCQAALDPTIQIPADPSDQVALDPTAQIPADADQSSMGGFMDLLHQLRSYELARMPRVSGTMLSAGCSDASYFDWIASCYGTVDRHVGVELYLPEPEALPAGVEWLKQSVGDMTGVEKGSVGLVFSGQTFEHLFGDDAVEFLLESKRVLEPAGWLVMDSPNREVTSALIWTQPQHTIEFTPAEAAELVTLAGFDVADVRGLWLCRDAITHEMMPLGRRVMKAFRRKRFCGGAFWPAVIRRTASCGGLRQLRRLASRTSLPCTSDTARFTHTPGRSGSSVSTMSLANAMSLAGSRW